MPLPGAAKTVQSGFAQGAADWRSGPRWSILSVLCPVHPFATTWHFPSRGNKEFEEKNRESYTSCTTPAFPLLVAAPPPCPVGSMSLDSRVAGLPYESSPFATPASGGTITRAYCRAIYEENVSRCFILSPGWGKVRRSRIRGSRAAANHQNAYHAIWQKDLSP